jgi:uncharacterized RDD family membrane protein YckC
MTSGGVDVIKLHAPLKNRIFSLFIDFLIIVAYALCLAGVTMLFFFLFLKGSVPSLNELQGNLVSFLTLLLPVYLYFVITESKYRHATIGKRKAKIMVASISGPLHLGQIMVRNFFKLLPWQMAHMAMFNVLANNSVPTPFFYGCIVFVYGFPLIDIAFVLFRKDRRSLHDLIARTIVVEKVRSEVMTCEE